jgi:uncharacterized caspase-like protein
MLRTVIALLVLMLVVSAAEAQKRVALVIGNGAYTKVPKLDNPKNDAAAMEAMLKAAGFDTVVRANDLGVAAMRRALRDFSDKTYDADIAVIFYAGHGIEVGGTNYLIPTDAVLERDIDAQDEAISLDRVSQILEPAKRLRLVILDACRDNPFVRSMRRTVATRAIRSGYGEIDERSLPPNTLVAYAQRAGATAEDGSGTNSPYTTALLKHLPTPGLDIELALRRVRDDVLKMTRNRQEPFRYGSLGGAEIALIEAVKTIAPLAAAPSSPPPPETNEAERAWAMAKDGTNVAALEAFTKRFKDTYYADLAHLRIEELKKQQASAPAVTAPNRIAPDPSALVRALQTELKRVGCDPGSVGEPWGNKARQALGEFAQMTKIALPNEEPSEAALNALLAQKARVCPLRCGAGDTEAGGRCVAKATPSPPKARAAPGPKANDTAKGAGPSQGSGMCWAGGGGNKFGGIVPCGDPGSSGVKAY